MASDLLWLAAGWLPLWAVALLLKQKLRWGRILMGAGLSGFVGGMCAVELRRHGLLPGAPGALVLPFHELHLDEILHFALLGAAGALGAEVILDRTGL
jgi:hypothetical protein